MVVGGLVGAVVVDMGVMGMGMGVMGMAGCRRIRLRREGMEGRRGRGGLRSNLNMGIGAEVGEEGTLRNVGARQGRRWIWLGLGWSGKEL